MPKLSAALSRAAGDDVPGDAAVAQVLQRLERACDGKGLAEARRDRGAEPDMTRHDAQGCDGRRRLEARLERGVIVRRGGETVGDEEQIELAPLCDACAGLRDRPAAIAVGRALHPPARRVIAGAEPEHGQMHLALLRSHAVLSPSSSRCRGRRTEAAKPAAVAGTLLVEPGILHPPAACRASCCGW